MLLHVLNKEMSQLLNYLYLEVVLEKKIESLLNIQIRLLISAWADGKWLTRTSSSRSPNRR